MNGKQLLKCTGSWLMLTTQLLVIPITGYPQSPAFDITPIVKRGDPSPDGGRFFGCDDCEGGLLGYRSFNDSGDAALFADTEGQCFDGAFLVSASGSVVLADLCRPTEFGRFSFRGLANVNDRGQASFQAGPVVAGRIVEMLFLYSDGHITKIVAEGDPTPVGTIFRGCGLSEPSINNSGEVAFGACNDNGQGLFRDGIFLFSKGVVSKVVTDTDATPLGGEFALNFFPPIDPRLNNNGDVLFRAGVRINPAIKEKFGLFLSTASGTRKIEVDGDAMPGGGVVKLGTMGLGDLNDNGEVAFIVALTGGQADGGIFLDSSGQLSKIMAAGDRTPIGGTFDKFFGGSGSRPEPLPRLNNNGAVAFKAFVDNGSAPHAIFLASPKAMVKVVAAGDRLPTGETIRLLDSFALNDLGQVAFFAYKKRNKTQPLGLYVATPITPQISSIKLKRKGGRLELRVNGNAMITNDTVIEIDGVALEATSYPAEFRENGGTTTRVVSRDSRLDEMVPAGQTVQVTVYNPLTNRRTAAAAFVR